MKLRKLLVKDASLMLEWMHDYNIVQDLKANFMDKNYNDCLAFIKESESTDKNLHLAIVNEDDEYLGTVSLKNIEKGKAELGIVIRKCAMGKGHSIKALQEIFTIGANDYNVRLFYWCVSPFNDRANRFYTKNGFKRFNPNGEIEGYTDKEIKTYYWYKYEA